MTIGKSNRCNEYMKEIEHIQYEYLQKNYGITQLQRKFYEHIVALLENLVNKYLQEADTGSH